MDDRAIPRAVEPGVKLASQTAVADDPLWYKDAVIYQLHVKAFCDSNDDGIGDFRGLASKLDYVRDLGVSAIWLMPFYPSPLKDDGYDVADHHNVHPQYGTRLDFRSFVREAHRRGLRVITELVINHTSDQHPWFQAARRAPPGSAKRNYYVWSDTDRKYSGTRIIFSDVETSNWTWDPVAKAFYWHRFFSHQPDLNFDNPSVLKAVFRTMRFWLDMGVDGFRLDAVPYLIEREGTRNENLPETHAAIKKFRAMLDAHYTGRMLLAEANQWPEDVRDYFGDGDECHFAYHFPLMPRMYMAIAQEDRHPIVEILQQTPDIPDSCQWAIFLRNHDELTLEMVTSKERDYMYRMYAADPRARCNLGIRRRLAPLLENDLDRIKLMNSLLLSMPGSPIIYYGDEIGMGDNIFLGDRHGVRTPMQWSPDRNAGFSRADPQRLFLAPIMDPIYGYEAVNVETQLREPSSLLNWMKRILAVRGQWRAFGRGRLTFLRPGNRKILAYLREHGDDVILCVANLAASAQPVELDLVRFRGRVPVELIGRAPFPPIGDLPYMLTLPARGFFWFRLSTDVPAPRWHEDWLPREDLPVLVLFGGWTSLFREHVVPWRTGMAERVRWQFEHDVLPRYIEAQGWYLEQQEKVDAARLHDHLLWNAEGRTWLIAQFDVGSGAGSARCFVPLALAWEETEEARVRALAAATIAKVRQEANVGVMVDAFADEAFCRAIVSAIGSAQQVATTHGMLQFTRTQAFDAIAGSDPVALPVGRAHTQGMSTAVDLGDRLFLKAYRRFRAGVNPELEIGRFLTERARFPHCVPVAGAVEYFAADGTPFTLALLQAYIANDGNGWSYTIGYLQRFLDDQRAATEPAAPDAHGAYLALVQTLGTRTAELHRALALRTGDPAFDPEPLTAEDLQAWRNRVREEASATLDSLQRSLVSMPAQAQQQAQAVLEQRALVLSMIDTCAVSEGGLLKTRCHGDYHLGQVLLTKNDFAIINFAGEPASMGPHAQSRHSPLSDVAGMMRSFHRARWTALANAAQDAGATDRLARLAEAWEAQVRATFLGAYDETARAGALYRSFEDVHALLPCFELEKALHEIADAIENRPDRMPIPLLGIAALAGIRLHG